MQIQGVRTTGIYCRADCRARPNAENVRPMPNVIAALAQGYRPCLVCRPDRLPELGLSATTPLVAHALRLVVSGFLDRGSLDDLAAQVGASKRHLNRLFEAEVGATPDFVGRANRAHLARRLLDESDLAITDVAFAAGFNSIRQMNRVMRELFGFAPSELRRRRRRGDVLDPLDGGVRLRVPHGGVDVATTLASLAMRATPGVEEVQGGVYRRTIRTCGHPGVAEVRDAGDGAHLEVTLHLATFGAILEQVARVRSLFGLGRGEGVGRPERVLGDDPILGAIVRRHPGVRMAGAWDGFETALRVLVGQQVSVAGATTVCGRIAARFGERVDLPLPGSLGLLFPSPRAIAAASPSDFDMPQSRARAIITLSAAIADGELDLTGSQPIDELVATLTSWPGIGPWSAHLIAARVFDQPDALPASDLGLRRAAGRLAGESRDLDARELERMASAWRPYRTTACAYLWRHLSELEAAERTASTTT